MKRIVSRTLSLLTAVCMLACAVPVFADDSPYDDVINWDYLQDISVYINDSQNWPDLDSEIHCFWDSSDNTHHFEYIGKGELQGWTFPKAVEGRDYELVSQSGNEVVIRYLRPNGIPYINAVVDFGDLTTKNKTKTSNEATSDTVQKTQNVAAETIEEDTVEESSETTTASAAQNSTVTPDDTYKNAAIAVGLVAAAAAITAAAVIIKKKHTK